MLHAKQMLNLGVSHELRSPLTRARLQVEISRLQYMLPRLQSLWTHFSKQKGGIGLKGEGEQQLELDREFINNMYY